MKFHYNTFQLSLTDVLLKGWNSHNRQKPFRDNSEGEIGCQTDIIINNHIVLLQLNDSNTDI